MEKNKMILIGIVILAIIVISVFYFKGKSGKTVTTQNQQNQQTQQTGNSTTVFSKTTTAKSAYNTALKEARKFSGDNYLVDLYTSGIQTDGKSSTWYVFFFSPSRNTNLRVNVVDGKIDRTEEKNLNKKDQISENWVDSTDVAKVAVPKCNEGGQYSNPDYFISLDAGKNNEPSAWDMTCLIGENKTLKVYVNAQTGEFLKTGKAGIGW